MSAASPNEPQNVSSASSLARDPARLAALCQLWKAAGRRVWLTLSGYSMAPTLLPGTRVLLDCACEPESMAVGDIVAFRRESSLVIHRLAEIASGQPLIYICKGDANAEPDPPVEAHAIVGRITQTRPPALLVRVRKTLGYMLRRYRQRSQTRPSRGAAL